MTRRLLLLLCLSSLLIAAATAYVVTIDTSRTLVAGEPLVVNGTSSLPAGFTTEVILYRGTGELARKTIVVQEDRTFSASFETTGLSSGDYKVELERQRDPSLYGSASVTTRPVTIVDRSGEVTVTSPAAQSDASNLTVSGTAPGKRSGSIAIAATGPGNFTYGPEYVRTDASGSFSLVIPHAGPGEYRVAISDPNGLITRYTVTVAAVTAEPTLEPTVTVPPTFGTTVQTTAVPTTALPTATRSGLSLLPLVGLGLTLLAFGRFVRRP